MTADLDALYRDVILDHNRHPRHFHALDGARHAEGHNPLCGDRLTVFVRLRDDVIAEASFQGFGCAIAVASASLMTESVAGKTIEEAEALFERLRGVLEVRLKADPTDETAPWPLATDDLGALSALAGVRRFPVRAKCATLPWQALLAAARANG